MRLGPVYFVTDPEAPASVLDQARAAVRAGIGTVQLRDKYASDAEMIAQARELQQITRAGGAMLVINDRVQVAIDIGADGLHVGQGDGDIAAIRARIGPDMALGLSIESLEQLGSIPPDTVTYLGIGPLRATASKPDAAQPLGMDGLERIIAATPLSCVAIGGIKPGDLAAIRQAGAVGVAVVSAISRARDMQNAARALIAEWSAE